MIGEKGAMLVDGFVDQMPCESGADWIRCLCMSGGRGNKGWSRRG